MLEFINHGRIREIRLARPPVNALNSELVGLLTRSMHDTVEEYDAVVLSGPQGMFSAGLDVVELMQFDRQGMTEFWVSFFRMLESIACSPVPVAVAITGHAPAGGAVICLMTDYRVMSRGKYQIGLNETRVGLVLPPLLQNPFTWLVGGRIAEQMLVAGTLVDPEKASEIGLVDALETGFEATIQRTVDWCEQILALPRNAMLGNRAIARAHFKQAFAEDLHGNVATFVDTWFSDETQQVLGELIDRLKNRR
jgi:Delta3-Delta2-enoyl-CoA isomerase